MKAEEMIRSLFKANAEELAQWMARSGEGPSDAVEVRISKRSPYMSCYLPPASISRNDHIHRRFGHLVVNPNDKYNTEALVESYAFPQNGESTQDVANLKETSRKFLESVIEAAHRARDLQYDHAHPDPVAQGLSMQRLFTLHGEKGCGKTFFLNYLLSKFSHELDERKTVWVRLNLVNEFGADNQLDHWIYAQTAKILMRYYDPTSVSFDHNKMKAGSLRVYDHLIQWLSTLVKQSNEYRLQLEGKIHEMRQVFQGKGLDAFVSPELVPMPVGREIFKYAQEEGYAVAVVLDGLDRLEATHDAKAKFEKLLRQVRALTNTDSKLGMVFVVVCRDASLPFLTDLCSNPYGRRQRIERRIVAVGLDEIIKKRINFIEKEVENLALERGWDTADWPSHIETFYVYLSRHDAEKGFKQLLESVLGSNRRAQMQVVQLSYYDYLQHYSRLQKQGERPYQLIEFLLKAGHRYPPRPYKYECGQDGHWLRTLRRELHFDSRFIPSVFTFPGLEKDEARQEANTYHGLAMGIRLLQIILAHESIIRQATTTVDRLTTGELSDICTRLFGYSKKAVLSLIEEYGEYELLFLSGVELPIPESPENYQIIPMPKATYLMEKFLYDVGYLNLAAMRAILPVELLRGDVPFVLACCYDDPDRDHLPNWVSAKLTNAVAIARAFSLVNLEQQRNFEKCFGKLSPRMKNTVLVARRGLGRKLTSMFEVPRRMQEHILLQTKKIIEHFESKPQILNDIENRMSRYFKKWYLAE